MAFIKLGNRMSPNVNRIAAQPRHFGRCGNRDRAPPTLANMPIWVPSGNRKGHALFAISNRTLRVPLDT